LRPGVNTVWEWGKHNSPPETILERAGYITSYNKHRLKRLADKKNGLLRDCGFDFLSLENDGQIYCGGQAKYYKEKVTANHIGTFQMYQNNLRAHNPKSVGYLYTSSNLQEDLRDCVNNPAFGITHILHKWKPINCIEASIVEIEECDLPLYYYQTELLEMMKDGVGLLGLYIPCGLGKTLIAGHHISRRNPTLIVAIAPLRASVANLKDRLGCFFKNYKSILVDSDESGTTDLTEVCNFLGEDGCKIIYSTFASAVEVLSEAFEDFTGGYIVGDEIHNALGNEKLCNFINSFENGLLMSATMPEELSVGGTVTSLSEIIDIGDTYSRSFAFAIERGLIVDYNLWLPHQTVADNGSTSVSIEIPVGFESYDKNICAMCCYLASGMLKTGSRRCIVYLGSQEECDQFISVAKDVFLKYHGLDLWAGKIISSVSASQRKRLLTEFQSGDGFRILTSVRILDEAIDVPRCDSVFITKVGEDSSDIRMMQRAMRSGRLDPTNPNKRNNIFLWADGWEKCIKPLELLREADPDFHKKVSIIDSDYDGQGSSKRVSSIISESTEFIKFVNMRCLSSYDRQIQWVNEIKTFYDKYNQEPKRNGVRENGYESSLNSCISRFVNLNNKGIIDIKIKNYINTTLPWFIWNKLGERNDRMISSIVSFYEKYNEPPKPSGKRDNEKILGTYLSNKRTYKRYGKLCPILEKRINEELPWFDWNPNENYHPAMIEKLCKFYNEFGSPPLNGGLRNGEKELATYMNNRRMNRKKGILDKNCDNLIQEKLPWFIWEPIEEQHLKTINELRAYFEKWGLEPKNAGKRENEARLAAYLGARRNNKGKGTLSIELENLLKEKLPWMRWNKGFFEQHKIMVERLQKFYEEHNDTPVCNGERTDEKELFTWISERRKNKKKGNLCKDTEKEISEKLPWFSWDAIDDNHTTKIEAIRKFYNEYGECPNSKALRPNEKELAKYIFHRRDDMRQ
jgi:superfamily II DNA or RNA helicase/sulfur relay (sulfurtransferase) DsrC/TusE family protein